MKQRTKDHLWSLMAGAGVVAASAAAAVAAAVIAVGGAGAGAGVTAAVATAIAVGAAASKESALNFKPLSAFGGAVLGLAGIFGSASHYGLLDRPETESFRTPETIEQPAFNQIDCRNIADKFNADNPDRSITASMNDKGQCVLTKAAAYTPPF